MDALRFWTSPFWSLYELVATSFAEMLSPSCSFTCWMAHASLPCASLERSVCPAYSSMMPLAVLSVVIWPSAFEAASLAASALFAICSARSETESAENPAESPTASRRLPYSESEAVRFTASCSPTVAFLMLSVRSWHSLMFVATFTPNTATPAAAADSPMSTGLNETPARASASWNVPAPPAASLRASATALTFGAAFATPSAATVTPAIAAPAAAADGAASASTEPSPFAADAAVGAAAFTAPNAAFTASLTPPRASEMVSLPIASSTPAMPRENAVPMFAIDVCMPPEADFACSANEAMPSPPSVSRRTMASSRSSIDRVASFLPPPSAAYRSFALAVGPSIDFASWSICPGMADVSERQSCISGLPLASIWRNCSIAAEVSCALDPDATSMSLRARPTSVAFERSFVDVTRPCTRLTISLSDVGMPCRRESIFESDSLTESAP